MPALNLRKGHAFGVGVPFSSTEAGRAFQAADEALSSTARSQKRTATDQGFQAAKKIHVPEAEQSGSTHRSNGKLPSRKFKPAPPSWSQKKQHVVQPDVEPARSRTTKDVASKRKSMHSMPVDSGAKEQDILFVSPGSNCASPSGPETPSTQPSSQRSPEIKIEPFDFSVRSTNILMEERDAQPIRELRDIQLDTIDLCTGNGRPMQEHGEAAMMREILAYLKEIPEQYVSSCALFLASLEVLTTRVDQLDERMYEWDQKFRKLQSTMYTELRFLHSLTQSGQTAEE